MDGGNSQNLHAVVITGLKDSSGVDKIALALSRIIKNMSPDVIERRLSSLPWTLTSQATSHTIPRLARFLDKAGVAIDIRPPLETSALQNASETHARPSTLSQTERPTFAATGDMPDKRRFQSRAAAPAQPPPPIEPSREVAPLTGQGSASQHRTSDGSGLLVEPLSLGGILDRTFQVCRGYLWKLFALQAPSGAAGALLGIAMIAGISAGSVPAQASGTAPPWEFMLLFPIGMLVLSVVLFLTHGACIHAVSCIYLGRDFQVRGAFSFAWSRLRKLYFGMSSVMFILFGLLVGVIVVGVMTYGLFSAVTSSVFWGVVLALPFWIALAYIPTYVFFRLIVVDAAIIVEDMGVRDAFKRSWNLVSGKAEGGWPRGYLLRAIILFHLFILITVAIHILVEVPAYLTGLMLPEAVAQILKEVLSNLGGIFAGIFNSVSGVIYYYDIRNRKEGFDIGMLAGTRDQS